MRTLGRGLGPRRVWTLAAVPMSACLLALACSEPARHRVLSFFFDGVPKPGEEKSKGYAPESGATSRPFSQAGTERNRPERLMFTHAPYRENQCDTCHNIRTGLLFKTPKQGLCRGCHPDVPGPEPFVHGPVAVNECLYCHDAHGSAYPQLLVEEPARLCFRCHQQKDLGPAPYHGVLATQTCGECHDSHGGSDRYFLKQARPPGPAIDSIVGPTPSTVPVVSSPDEPAGEDR